MLGNVRRYKTKRERKKERDRQKDRQTDRQMERNRVGQTEGEQMSRREREEDMKL